MKKWRKSRNLEELPSNVETQKNVLQQMKWRSSKGSHQQVANSIQVLESRGDSIQGAYFRSLSEDNNDTTLSVNYYNNNNNNSKEENEDVIIINKISSTSSSISSSFSSPSPPPPERRHSNSNSTASVVRERSQSTIAAAAVLAAVKKVSREEGNKVKIKLDNYMNKSNPPIDINIKKINKSEDPWSYSISRNSGHNNGFNNIDNYNNIIINNTISNNQDVIDLNWSPPSSVRSTHQEIIPGQISINNGEEIPEDPWSNSKTLNQFSPMASTASLISSQLQTSSSRFKLRCSWAPGIAAMIVAFSAAASLGNLLRLPRLVLLHGGGPFLVAYIILLVVLGLPLTFLEIGLGQFCQQGSLQIYRAVPLLKGVGVVKLMTGLLLCTYYSVIMSVSLFSLIWSAKGPIPFAECNKIDRYYHAFGFSLATSKEISFGETCLKQSILKPPEEDAMWLGVNYALLFLLWALLTLSQWGGTPWYRRTMVITVPIGIAALIAVLVHATTAVKLNWPLDWSNWGSLLKPEVWYFATVQVFFSTQVGFGVHVTNAGKIFPKQNVFWVSLSFIIINLLVGIAAVWLSWLWLDSSSIQTPSQLTSDLPEILILSLLVDYATNGPQKLTQMWACFACLMLIVAGVISMTNMLYSLITAIASETPAEKFRRWHIVAGICAIGFVTGVLCFIPFRLQFVHILDHYVIGRLLIATTILELIGFAWIYGCSTLYNDFEFVLGQKMNSVWKIIWIITPAALLAVELWSIFQLPLDGLPHSQTNVYPDPDWVTITGWSVYLSMWLIVFGSAIWTLGQQVDYNFSDRLRSSIKPSSKWGPADPLHRHGWVRWRTQYSTTGRKDFTLRRRGTRDYTHSARGSPATTLGRPTHKNGGPSPLAAVGTATSMPWQTNPSP